MTSSGSPPLGVDELMSSVYDQLRALAGSKVAGALGAAQPTSLVHEAWLRLSGSNGGDARFRDREHFLAVAALAMRQILADRARRRAAKKRGGDWDRVTLSGVSGEGAINAVDLVALDDALRTLEALDVRQAQLVTLRLFGGLTVREIADQLTVSESTVEKEWRRARAWLSARLEL